MDAQTKPTILVVDDTETNIDILVDTLEADYEVSVAMDGESALETVESDPPELILLDIMMPGMDGYEVCRRLKADEKTRHIPIIFVTAKGEVEDEKKGLQFGAVDYITKPFSPPIVQARVKNHLELKHRTDEQIKLNSIISENLNSVITLLSTLIESTLFDSRGHAEKVVEISVHIAKSLDLHSDDIRYIEMTAFLQEIGKVGLPPPLFKKNVSELTDREKVIINSHAIRGASILENYPGLQEVSLLVRHLQENFDGSGSPDKLEGDKIPIGSRIVRVAGTFHNRVARVQGGDVRKVLEALEENAGSSYDPSVVKELFKFVNEHKDYKAEATKEVLVYELKLGMELATGIFLKNGTKLLGKDSVLTEKNIDQALQFHKKGALGDSVTIKI